MNVSRHGSGAGEEGGGRSTGRSKRKRSKVVAVGFPLRFLRFLFFGGKGFSLTKDI